MGYFLGIDLGTTYTAAATSTGQRVRVAPLGGRATSIPSVVLLREDGEVLVGEAAERRAILEPHRIAREFKRRVGDPTPLIVGGAPYSADALTAKLLRSVVERVTDDEGEPPAGIAVCHPANWGAYKQDRLQQAIRLADLDDVATLSEPEAAALHYAAEERVEPGSVIAVYDLGGGTFDAAVLRRTEESWEILGTPEGVERLGGVDFDEAVFQHVVGKVLPTFDQLDTDDPPTITAVARLRQECIQAKEALTLDTEVSIPVLLPSVQTDFRLTREELETMIRPALLDSVAALRRALRAAEVEPDDVSTVLLVGGSSRIPLVAELVESELGRPVALDAHPKHSVALGAARVAAERGPVGVGAAGSTESADGAEGAEGTGDTEDGGEPAAQEPAAVAGDETTNIDATLIARPEELGLPAEEVLAGVGAPVDGGSSPATRVQTAPVSDGDGVANDGIAAASAGGGEPGGALADDDGDSWADGAVPGEPETGDAAALPGGPETGDAAAVPGGPETGDAGAPPDAPGGESADGADEIDVAAAVATGSDLGWRPALSPPTPPGLTPRPGRPRRKAPSQSTLGLVVGSIVAALLLLVVMMVALRTDSAGGRRSGDDAADIPAALTPGDEGSSDRRDDDDVDRDRDDNRRRSSSSTTAPESESTSTTRRGTSTTDGRTGTTTDEGTTTTVEETTTTTEATTTTTEATTTTTEATTTTTAAPVGTP